MSTLHVPYRLVGKLLGIILVLSTEVGAQDLKAALLKMKSNYVEATNLHIVMSIKAFDEKATDKYYMNQRAQVKKSGQRYFYEFNGMTMLLNENYLVVANQKLKQILFAKNKTTAAAQMEKQFKFNIDSLLTAFGTSTYRGSKSGIDHFNIVHNKGSIQETDMYFETTTGQLKEIDYSYSNGQRVSIHFEVFESNPAFEENTFSESEFFDFVNNQLIPSKKYVNYKVVDIGTKKGQLIN